ncbi:hypothetical protein H4R34_005377 [Dimargaris verticillata]|uniref:Integrase catalytic domain-containing protein n=1 Tax=Dimargaris verticillata TaxID=2761393 RepID=A0A9W8AYB1_9FUNG|nr:hypothetical protein H4R34_005377 [Dimargaris verticillata]
MADLSPVEVLQGGWLEVFGHPQVVTSDNAWRFWSQTFTQFLQAQGIQHIFTPAYHPQANLAECYVGLFKQALLKCLHDQGREQGWTRFIPQIVAAHAILPDPQSGIAPWTALFANQLLIPVDTLLVHPDDAQSAQAIAQRMLSKAQEIRRRRAQKDMAKFNQFASRQAYTAGQLVTVKVLPKATNLAERESRRQGPFLVVARHGLVYQLSQLDGTLLPKQLPGDQLMPYYPADDQSLRVPSVDQVAQVTLGDADQLELDTLHTTPLPSSSPGICAVDSGAEAPASFSSITTQPDTDSLIYDIPPSLASSYISDQGESLASSGFTDELPPARTDSRASSPNPMDTECPLSRPSLDDFASDNSVASSLPLEDFAFQSASPESLLPYDECNPNSLDSPWSSNLESAASPGHDPSSWPLVDKRPPSRNPSDLTVGWIPLRHSKRSRHQSQQDPEASDAMPEEDISPEVAGDETEPGGGSP